MSNLNNILHELGISKVKLAKYLGVSRQMIYNYLELNDINKWPKEKKVLLFNLLNIKSSDELKKIKVDTDYIKEVESRLNNTTNKTSVIFKDNNDTYTNLGKKEKELLHNIIDLVKEFLETDDEAGYNTAQYLYYFLQLLGKNRELKYLLGYIAKKNNAVKVNDYVFNKDEQFIYEAIMYWADALYINGASKTKLAVAHSRFEKEVEHRLEEQIGRTRELINLRDMALKELGLKRSDDNSEHYAEISRKMAEIESRTMSSYRR